MSWFRQLGNTDLRVSALGLGTVKLGRDQGLRYPGDVHIPDDRAARKLLDQARDSGINLIDTAPAYGNSEQRLGHLLRGQQEHWLICSKVGEEFDGQRSRFDFSPQHTRLSVQRSLDRLGIEALDIALIHSDGRDLIILEQLGTLETLRDLQREGLVRAVGISSKTVEGGLAAVALCDVLMLSFNPLDHSQAPVLEACARAGAGVLIKKALDSGHALTRGDKELRPALAPALGHPATGSVVVGTSSADHLLDNVSAARALLP